MNWPKIDILEEKIKARIRESEDFQRELQRVYLKIPNCGSQIPSLRSLVEEENLKIEVRFENSLFLQSLTQTLSRQRYLMSGHHWDLGLSTN